MKTRDFLSKLPIPPVVKDVSVQALGGYLSTAALMLRGFLLAGLLPPIAVGTVASVGLVLSYARYADLGMSDAVAREIPLAWGAGRKEEVPEWTFYSLAAKLLSGVLVSVGIATYAFFRWDDLAAEVRFGLATACLVVVLQGLNLSHQATLRARQQFTEATIVTSLVPTGNLAIGVLGAIFGGVRGVFVGQVIAFASAVWFGFRVEGFPVFRPHLRKSLNLLKLGFPLAVLAFVDYSLVYIDQILILAYLDRVALGIYTLVLYAGAALFLLPMAIAQSVGPRLLRRYGEHGSIHSISELTWRPVSLLSLTMPIAVMVLWICGPIIISAFLPDYRAAIAPMRIYLLGIFFLGLNLGVSTTLLAVKKFTLNIPIVVVSITVNILVDAVLLGWLNLGLIGAAAGSFITYTFYWFIHTTFVRWLFNARPGKIIKANLASGWPGALLVGFATLSWYFRTLNGSHLILELAFLLLLVAITLLRWQRCNPFSPKFTPPH